MVCPSVRVAHDVVFLLQDTTPARNAVSSRHSRGEVVYAFLAHGSGVGEELGCEKRSVEGRGGGREDGGSCSWARSGK